MPQPRAPLPRAGVLRDGYVMNTTGEGEMNQTFNVTSCRTCPLLHYTPGSIDDNCEQVPPEYTCKHPQGEKVGDMWRSIRDGDLLPSGCPLRTGSLVVRQCPSQCRHPECIYLNGERRCLLCGVKVDDVR